MTEGYFINKMIKEEELAKGLKRKVLAHNNRLMLVKVDFEEGVVGEPHSHPNEQITYVLEGEFDFTIGDETVLLKKGDSAYIKPDKLHSTICRVKGSLLDTFTPMREDFI